MSDWQGRSEGRATRAETRPRAYTPDSDSAVRRATTAAPPQVRAREPIGADLETFLRRRLSATHDGRMAISTAGHTSIASALQPGAEPWPLDLALLFLLHLGELLDEAEAMDLPLVPFSPRCVALDGAFLVVSPDDEPLGVDPAYVAPEQRDAAATVDARASQYGLATLAMVILDVQEPRGAAGGRAARASGTPAADAAPRSRVDPAAVRVLLAARAPDPDRRFSTASDLLLALDAACGELTPSAESDATRLGFAPITAMPRAVVVEPRPRRISEVGVMVALAAIVGGGAGAFAARRPAAVEVAEASALGADSSGALLDGAGDEVAPAAARRRGGSVLDAVAKWSSTGPVPPAATAGGDVVPGPGDGAGRARAEAARDDRPTARERRRAAGDEPTLPRAPTGALTRMQALANSVSLPGGDRAGDLQRRVVDPSEFATGRLAAGGSEGAARAGGERGAASPAEVRSATLVGNAPLRYPPTLLARRVAGEVVARYVVDTNGRVDPGSFELVRTTNVAFTSEVREALAAMRYLPAESGGRRVRQSVVQTFQFTPP